MGQDDLATVTQALSTTVCISGMHGPFNLDIDLVLNFKLKVVLDSFNAY